MLSYKFSSKKILNFEETESKFLSNILFFLVSVFVCLVVFVLFQHNVLLFCKFTRTATVITYIWICHHEWSWSHVQVHGFWQKFCVIGALSNSFLPWRFSFTPSFWIAKPPMAIVSTYLEASAELLNMKLSCADPQNLPQTLEISHSGSATSWTFMEWNLQ